MPVRPALLRRSIASIAAGAVLGTLAPSLGLPSTPASAAPMTAEPTAPADGVVLEDLLVERKPAPIGIDVERPRFAWNVASGVRDTTQEAYQVWVATSAEALDAGDVVWDSGVVRGDASHDIAYDGAPLESATDYAWRVEVRTTAGRAQADSSFRTGLFDEAAWGDSEWIGNDRVQRSADAATLEGASWIHLPYSGANTPPGYFRQRFTTAPGKTIRSAELVMAGDIGFAAYLNGTQVASRPSVADAWRTGARAVVRPQAGANLLAVRMNNTAKAFGAVVGKLRITYTDGSVQDVVTDNTWKAAGTATPGWHLAAYDDAAWVAAAARAVYGSGPWGAGVTLPNAASVDTRNTFDTASWIIPPIGAPSPSNPIPTTLFRREIEVPAGKEVAWAQLAATGDQVFEAYWNGERVAFNTGANNEWQAARAVNLSARTGTNVLALRLTTPGTAQYGGVLARVRIGYTDGTTQDIATDRTFSALAIGAGIAPTGWNTVGFDDSAWPAAREEALYRNWVYGDRVTIPNLDVASAALGLAGSQWIWTPEATTPQAPAQDRAFRRTVETPDGTEATRAEIIITGDDSFALWANGTFVGRSQGATNEWQVGRRFTVDLEPDRNVFAVRTTNTLESNGTNSPAGMIAAIRVHYADGSFQDVRTGADWRATKEIPDGFESPDLDDSGWTPAAVQAAYGSGPWGSRVQPEEPVNPAPLLRKEFEVAGDVASATLFVAAGGYADATLNGAPVSEDVLSPGFTDYDDVVQYVGTDVTDQLTEGANALGLELGRGFYGMTGGNVWNWQSPPWHDEPVARAVLHIEYADGSTDEIVTDDSWTRHDGPTVFDDLYAGEKYDASKVQDGWNTVGFDDGDWEPAAVVAGPKGELVNQRQQPIRVTEELPAAEITEPTEGVYVVRFPRVLAGWVEVTATGPAGTEIEMRYAEKLRASGLVNQDNNGGFQKGFQTDRFVLAGTGEAETWEAKFSYKGFHYVQVTGWPGDEPPTLEDFTAKAVHTDAAEVGSFDSSNEIMNRTHRAVVDTLKNNIHHIPTDTPMFEKNGWTGDAAVGAEMFMMNLDVHELFAKWIGDVDDSRDANGAPLVIAPSSDQWGQWGLAQPWHSAYVLIPYWLYQYGGDRQVMQEYYPNIKRYVDLEFGRSANGLVTANRLGDWVNPEASPAGGNAPEDSRVSGTAYLYTMLTTMVRVADLLGRPGDAARFADNAAVVKQAFNNAYLDEEAGYYKGQAGDRGYRQTHNVLALAFGLVPDAAMEQRVADSIAADVRAKGDTLNTGTLGTKYLLPVLTEHGHADLAYTLALQTAYPSWGYMIENGATSMWEHWATEARSLGHYFLGTVDDWFYHYVGGIRPSADQGFRRTTIAPVIDERLGHASATVPTPFGSVSSAWERTEDATTVDVEVPVGVTGVVRLPATSPWVVSESGDTLAEPVDGVRRVSVVDGQLEVVVGSGSYSFEIVGAAGDIGGVLDRIDELVDVTTALRDEGTLARATARAVLTRAAAARSAALDALAAATAGDDVEAATALASSFSEVDAIEDALAGVELPAEDAATLGAAVAAAREAIGEAVTSLLGLDLTATIPPGKVKPGGSVEIALTAGNDGGSEVEDLVVEVAGPDDEWTADPPEIELAPTLASGAEVTGTSTVTVPAEAPTGPTPVDVDYRYTFAGHAVEVSRAVEVVVDAPVVITATRVEPSPARPGTEAIVAVDLANQGTAAATVDVALTLPEGWEPVDPTAPVRLRADETGTVEIPVRVPRDAPRDAWDAEATADVRLDETVIASAPVTIAVAIAPEVEPVEGYDHVDLGDAASEEAHGLSASATSGTSSEAGFTRRYAGHLTPFSYFEFDLAVVPGEPFVLRTRETYDRAQTKRYKVYVDGEELLLRTITNGGAGTVTWETVVPADLATDATVRVRFENQDDPAFYDPSIADVWSLPYDEPADDLVASAAPEVSGPARLGGELSATTGTWDAEGLDFAYQWLRDGLAIEGAEAATYVVTAKDLDRAISVRVTASRDGSWPARADSAAVTPAKVAATIVPKVTRQVVKRGVKVTVRATVRSALPVDGLKVRVVVDGEPRGFATIEGRVAVRSFVLTEPGRHRIEVAFPGSPGIQPATSPARTVVVR